MALSMLSFPTATQTTGIFHMLLLYFNMWYLLYHIRLLQKPVTQTVCLELTFINCVYNINRHVDEYINLNRLHDKNYVRILKKIDFIYLFILFIYLKKPLIGEHKHKTKNMTYNNKITPQITQT